MQKDWVATVKVRGLRNPKKNNNKKPKPKPEMLNVSLPHRLTFEEFVFLSTRFESSENVHYPVFFPLNSGTFCNQTLNADTSNSYLSCQKFWFLCSRSRSQGLNMLNWLFVSHFLSCSAFLSQISCKVMWINSENNLNVCPSAVF